MSLFGFVEYIMSLLLRLNNSQCLKIYSHFQIATLNQTAKLIRDDSQHLDLIIIIVSQRFAIGFILFELYYTMIPCKNTYCNYYTI